MTDWLPEEHLSFIVNMVVDELNISNIENKYQEEGKSAYSPRMMLKILFYAYTSGIRSSQEIAKRLKTDLAYMFLSGRQTPNFRTICNFRKNNVKELHNLLVQIVILCKEMGLVKLGHIAMDRIRIRGNASKKRTKTKENSVQEIRKILVAAEAIDKIDGKEKDDEEERLFKDKVELLKRLEEANKILERLNLDKVNLTEPEATFQKT